VSSSALVIGGGGGIGAAVCRRLSSDQHVVLTYLGHRERAWSLAEQLTTSTRTAEAVRVMPPERLTPRAPLQALSAWVRCTR